ncbi:hypothetical protein PS6_011460 [Mucor atramentarius]
MATKYAREKQEEQEKKEAERKRMIEEIEAKLKKLYELSLECSELEFLRIDIDSALIKKNINDILKYKKGAENRLKVKARYISTSRFSLYRKKLPTAKQNDGSSLEKVGFFVKMANDVPKRKRNEMEDNLVADNSSVVTTIGQTGTLDEQLTTELYMNVLEDIAEGSVVVIDYEKEEELEDISARAKSVEDVEEMEALIPVLEDKYNRLTISDTDQQQTDRASFDLRKYNTFLYPSLIEYFKKRCFDKKKKVEASKEVADLLWNTRNSEYFNMKIRSWTAIFVCFKALPNYKKGFIAKHIVT